MEFSCLHQKLCLDSQSSKEQGILRPLQRQTKARSGRDPAAATLPWRSQPGRPAPGRPAGPWPASSCFGPQQDPAIKLFVCVYWAFRARCIIRSKFNRDGVPSWNSPVFIKNCASTLSLAKHCGLPTTNKSLERPRPSCPPPQAIPGRPAGPWPASRSCFGPQQDPAIKKFPRPEPGPGPGLADQAGGSVTASTFPTCSTYYSA